MAVYLFGYITYVHNLCHKLTIDDSIISMALSVNSAIRKKKPRDGQTDQQTDGRTDRPSYRDAWTHLKNAPDRMWVVTSLAHNF